MDSQESKNYTVNVMKQTFPASVQLTFKHTVV